MTGLEGFCELCIEWKTWNKWILLQLLILLFPANCPPSNCPHVDCVGELHNIIHIAFCGCFVAFNIIYSDRGNLCSILHLNFHSRLFPRVIKSKGCARGGSRKIWNGCWFMCLELLPKDSPIIKPPREKREPKPDSSRLDMTWCWSLSHGWASFQTSLFRASTVSGSATPATTMWRVWW